MRSLLAFLVSGVVAVAQAPLTVQVPAQAPTIQLAIVFAPSGSTIVVAPGVYGEDLNFLGRQLTVVAANGSGTTILEGYDNDVVVRFVGGEGPATVLDGFTIRNGRGLGATAGGIQVVGASPTIRNCVITANVGATTFNLPSMTPLPTYAGGAHVENGSPLFENCSFNANLGSVNGAGTVYLTGNGHTGGLSLKNAGAVVRNCTFVGNVGGRGSLAAATNPGGAGAVDVVGGSATFEDCSFTGNTGGLGGLALVSFAGPGGAGGMRARAGANVTLLRCIFQSNTGVTSPTIPAGAGGLDIDGADVVVDRGRFIGNVGGNTTTYGAASAVGGAGAVQLLSGTVALRNSLLRSNTGGSSIGNEPPGAKPTGAGGLAVHGGAASVRHSTLVGNTSGSMSGFFFGSNFYIAAAGIHLSAGSATVTSSIVRQSVLGTGPLLATPPYYAQISSVLPTPGGADVTYSNVENLSGGLGNQSGDALFVSFTDLRLTNHSPCIDAGVLSTTIPEPLDLDGDPRTLYAATDIGADEYRSPFLDGAVGLPGSGPHLLVGVDGDNGPEVTKGLGVPITLTMAQPPSTVAPASFALAALPGIAPPAGEFPLGTAGTLVFSPFDPDFLLLASSFASLPGAVLQTPPTPWFAQLAAGIPVATTLTIQGLVDEGGGSLKVTNVIFLTIN